MLTVKEVAERFNLSPGRIHQLIKEQKIVAHMRAGVYFIEESEAEKADWNRKPGPKK